MATIYLLIFPNGKLYVGQTRRTVKQRMAQHANNAQQKRKNLLLYNAWRKYGIPTVTELWNGPASELNAQERECIRLLDCMEPKGYNLTSGGDSAPGIRSAESLARTSAALMGKHKGRKLTGAHLESTRSAQRVAREAARKPDVRARAVAKRRITLLGRLVTCACQTCGAIIQRSPKRIRLYCNNTCKFANPTWRAMQSASHQLAPEERLRRYRARRAAYNIVRANRRAAQRQLPHSPQT